MTSRYRCSALPTELSSELRAGHVVSSYYSRRWWRMQWNIRNTIYSNSGRRYEDMIDRRGYTEFRLEQLWSLKPKTNFRPERGIRTHDLCDTGAVLYQVSYQAIWELVTLRVRNIPVESEECKWIYESSYIWNAEEDMNLWWIIAVIHTTWADVKLKPEKYSCLNGIRTGMTSAIPVQCSTD